MALGSTQPLTEMSTRNLPGGKGRPARGADNLTAVRRLSRKCGSLIVSQRYGPSWPVTGIAVFLGYMGIMINVKFEVLTMVTMKITVFGGLTSCSLMDIYQTSQCHVLEDSNQHCD
jgi:hypothetical protein